MFEGMFGDQPQTPSSPSIKKEGSKKFGGGGGDAGGGGGGGGIANLAAVLQGQMAQQQQHQQPHVPASNPYSPPPSFAPPPTPVPSIPKVPTCSVLHDYQGRTPTELSLQTGEVVTILQKDPGGWWEGEVRGQRGWFPSNFVSEQ